MSKAEAEQLDNEALHLATHIVIRPGPALVDATGSRLKVGDLVDCTLWKPRVVHGLVDLRYLEQLPPLSREQQGRTAVKRAELALAELDNREAELRAELKRCDDVIAAGRRRELEFIKILAERDQVLAEMTAATSRGGGIRTLLDALPRERERFEHERHRGRVLLGEEAS